MSSLLYYMMKTSRYYVANCKRSINCPTDVKVAICETELWLPFFSLLHAITIAQSAQVHWHQVIYIAT